MADVLVTGIKIGDMPLKGTVSGNEKLPTGDVGDLAVTPNQIKDFTIQQGDLVSQTTLDDAVEALEQTSSGLAGRVQTLENRTSNVDNTSDLNKPISNATQAALELKADKSEVDSSLALKANKADVYDKTQTYNQTEIDNKITGIQHNNLQGRSVAGAHPSTSITHTNSTVYDVLEDLTAKKISSVDSVSSLSSISSPVQGMTVFVKSYYTPNFSLNNPFIGGGLFTYDPSKSLINDGGVVINGWVRHLSGYVSFDMFGLDSTGSTPCDDKLKAVFLASSSLKVPVKNNSGIYLLNGTSEITIGYSADLTGSLFKLGGQFNTSIVIDLGIQTTVYDATSSIVTLLKTGGVLSKNSAKINVLQNDSTLNDSYVGIFSSQPMYNYRGSIQTRFDLNRVFKNGHCQSTFFYDFDLSTVTSIRSQKVNSYETVVEGLSFDETLVTNNVTLLRVRNSNRLTLKSLRFIDNNQSPTTNTKNRLGIDVSCHDISVIGMDCVSAYINSNNDSNYTIFAGENYGLHFEKILSDGNGWGAFGMNNCKRITIRDSQVNRIDFHKPFHEFLDIENCVIGNWGLLVTAMGDLRIRNNKFLLREAIVNDGIIRSRDDTGGFCNGDLLWENNIVEGSLSSQISLARCQVNSSYSIPEGSPVRKEFFTNMLFDGIFVRNNALISGLIDSNQTFSGAQIMLPKMISINNYQSDSSGEFLTQYLDRFMPRIEGVVYNIKNMNVGTLNILDNSNGTQQLLCTINNLRDVSNGATTLVVKGNGQYTINNSKLMKYREFSGSYGSFTPQVRINGGEMYNLTDTVYFDIQNTAKDRVIVRGTDFTVGDSNAFRNDLNFFTSYDCRYNGVKTFSLYSGDGSQSTASVSIPAYGDLDLIVKSGIAGSIKSDRVLVDISVNGSVNLPSSSGTISCSVSGGVATLTFNVANIRSVGMMNN